MDVVVTVPKSFGLERWASEGDAVGEEYTGEEWGFFMGGSPPRMTPGDRVYIVCEGKLRGYAPLVRIERTGRGYALVRRGDAVAVTLAAPVRGFQGYRYRWWDRAEEIPFPKWREP